MQEVNNDGSMGPIQEFNEKKMQELLKKKEVEYVKVFRMDHIEKEIKENHIDIDKEYILIKEKRSILCRRLRDYIVFVKENPVQGTEEIKEEGK